MPKISELPAVTTPANDDTLAMVDQSGSITAKITRGDLLKGSPLPANTVDSQAIASSSVTPSKLSPQVLAAGLTADYSVPSTATNLNLNTSYSDISAGTALTLSGGKVVVGSGVSAVSTHFKGYISGDTGSGAVRFQITKNGTVVSEYFFSSGSYHFNHLYFEVPYLGVTSGDTIGIIAYSSGGGTLRSGEIDTSFTVKAIG